ncbi:hypothetical protein B1R32_10559 [Abditibacterium utsteinense]|uniref:Type II secretion system (T2SS), protein G n=1 Tax=Abditibacterium utsteinense TaxID=1960156 RepID=A0A2S8SUB6_9BACT|nr:hypothetical protein [Abditibacterium utsteinense]PQV64378.1 hypothetical protein B1R32_10559 [Abditibacterium utsteinense]
MFSKFKLGPKTPEILEKRRNLRRKIIGTPGRIWRKTRRGLAWTLAIGFIAHSALNIYSSVLLNHELSAIREKGEPLQFAELAPPDVPDSQNAALVYAQATKTLHFSGEEKAAFNARSSQRTPQQQQIIAAALTKNQKSLNLARRAASMPLCRFPLDYKTANPTALLFPYYAEMRELARLLSAQATLEAKNGESAAALRDVRAVFNMAHHLSNEPALIGFLVAGAVDSIANQALAQVLENVPLTLAQARAFQTSLPATDWNRAFHHCLLGERAWGIFALELMNPLGFANFAAEYTPDSPEPSQSWAYYPLLLLLRPGLKLDEVQSLRLWKRQLDAASNPQISAFSNFNKTMDQAIEKVPRTAILTRMLMPVFSSSGDNRDRDEVRRREREIALALTVYRTQKGQYPQKMKELNFLWKSALPLDPYSNKSFVYRRENSGFTLYSIGVNRKDDDGRVRNYDGGSGNWRPDDDDIVWSNSAIKKQLPPVLRQ